MKQAVDVIVAGGGIVGLTAALAMGRQGYSTALLEAGTLEVNTSQPDLRVYAINQASQNLLKNLGAWKHLNHQRIAPYQNMKIWDGANGAVLHFDSRTIAAPDLGSIIEESILKQALLAAIKECKKVQLFEDCKINSLQNEEGLLSIESDRMSCQGKLLMAADGANSPLRKQLGVELTQWSYHQQAIVATVSIANIHQDTAWQVFNPDGPLAFLPLADPHKCSIVWSTTLQRAKHLMALSEEEFNKELNSAFANTLGDTRLISTRHQFPLIMRHAKQYSGSNWMLLGDAAHTIHPLAGLGLNVGLADISFFLNCVQQMKQPYSFKKALSAYQRQRKSEVWKVIATMEALKNVFGQTLTPITILRGFGLRLCNQSTLVKRLFIREAIGGIN